MICAPCGPKQAAANRGSGCRLVCIDSQTDVGSTIDETENAISLLAGLVLGDYPLPLFALRLLFSLVESFYIISFVYHVLPIFLAIRFRIVMAAEVDGDFDAFLTEIGVGFVSAPPTIIVIIIIISSSSSIIIVYPNTTITILQTHDLQFVLNIFMLR